MTQKNANIKNINTIGLIMRIAIIIARIFVGIAFVLTLLGCVLALWMPVKSVRIKPDVHIDIEYDEPKDGEKLVEGSKTSKWNMDEISVKWYLKEKEAPAGKEALSIDGDVEEITGSQIKGFVFKKCLIATLFCAAMFVALLFGGKLAKTLEKCETPFSDDVIHKLVNFGKALIPLGVLALLTGTTGIPIAFGILIIFLFVSLFKYGAELQKEADETV